MCSPRLLGEDSSDQRIRELRSDADVLAAALRFEAPVDGNLKAQDARLRAFDHALSALCCPHCGERGVLVQDSVHESWRCCICDSVHSGAAAASMVTRLRELVTRIEVMPRGDAMKIAAVHQALRICAHTPEGNSSYGGVEVDGAICSALGAQGLPTKDAVLLHPLHRLNVTLYMTLVEECLSKDAAAEDSLFRSSLDRLVLVCRALLPVGSAERRRFESFLAT
mmetsp:Transcript_6775/g.26179  ORF Transcript_6775/g.26179 Transcript_6775/m.26179 type:complete len:224 (-) Transcript_6775:53-724(-)